MPAARRLRVIQCGTGVAGRQALRAILDHPRLELAGLLVHGDALSGRNAAEIAGTGNTNVVATRDFQSLLDTDADAVCYMLLLPDVAQICALLAAGTNVVTTAGLI